MKKNTIAAPFIAAAVVFAALGTNACAVGSPDGTEETASNDQALKNEGTGPKCDPEGTWCTCTGDDCIILQTFCPGFLVCNEDAQGYRCICSMVIKGGGGVPVNPKLPWNPPVVPIVEAGTQMQAAQ